MSDISGSTVIPTEFGTGLTIGQIAALHPVEYNSAIDYNGPRIFMENGYLTTPRFFFISRLDDMVEITLVDGKKLKARKTQKVLTSSGFTQIQHLKPQMPIGVVGDFFNYSCLTPTNVEPVVDITKHLEYMDKQVHIKMVPISARKAVEGKEPGFSFGIPYYMRYIANGIVCHD